MCFKVQKASCSASYGEKKTYKQYTRLLRVKRTRGANKDYGATKSLSRACNGRVTVAVKNQIGHAPPKQVNVTPEDVLE